MSLRTMVAAAAMSLLAAATAESQGTPAALVGQVRDGVTGKPLPGAVVTLDGTMLGARTDSVGLFRISHRGVLGHVPIRVRLVGYTSFSDAVTLVDATSDLGLVMLYPSPLMFWVNEVPQCAAIATRPDSLGRTPYREWVREYVGRDGRHVLELCRLRLVQSSGAHR